ncbi:hypothetical protein LIER_13618 [Lithospermum erythrorhizon]|uniref:Uncharacterized protein n=1 Tax=Lithospermum erythrorhizon TaxID=34254 RepID=A0AAV3PYC1_LITER
MQVPKGYTKAQPRQTKYIHDILKDLNMENCTATATPLQSESMQQPTNNNWNVALDIVKYLNSTPSHGLFYSSQSDLTLEAYCDANWARCKLSEPQPIVVRCNNKSAIHMIENPVFHECTKHIELDCHLVRDHYKQGFIKAVHVPTKD